MVTDKLRKYVLPNIPYVFIGWVFLKLGTAYRLAAGSDFAHKLLGLGQTIGAAFADIAPGLKGTDGTEVGIYGGSLPYDPTPTNPQITKFNVAAKSTADGKLSVDIEVNSAN